MATGILHIDLSALADNWRALDRASASHVQTAAVVKADGYGLGAARVARALAQAGARRFFVAVPEEGAVLREALGPDVQICVFAGHMAGDTDMIGDLGLTPMLNSMEQLTRHFEALPGAPFGIQLDTGMNRLGMEAPEWAAVRDLVEAAGPQLIMSHLACADEPDHAMNARQLKQFREMTDGTAAPRSFANTGGILLGPEYHFEITRPGIGLYGGEPFKEAAPVVRLSLPVIQTRELAADETVGYGNAWTTQSGARIATLAGGYADGITRHLSNKAMLFHGKTACRLAGRVSMDLLTVDITNLEENPRELDLICPAQGVDALAKLAGTIGYELLTQLGARYQRRYAGSGASRSE
ncbi:MAG: alanine racemase [Paracoccaceae bacterium]